MSHLIADDASTSIAFRCKRKAYAFKEICGTVACVLYSVIILIVTVIILLVITAAARTSECKRDRSSDPDKDW